MKGYKAYKKGLICEPCKQHRTQYEVGETYETEAEINPCENGFHFCENPLDTLSYYPLIDYKGDLTEFTEVEAIGDVKRGRAKFCTNKIKIGIKLDLKAFIKASINFVLETTKVVAENSAKLASSGDSAKLASSGNYAKLASSGYSAQLASSGYCAQLASSGDSAQLASSGDYAQLASSGNYAKLASSGYYGIVAGIGTGNRAKAKKGSWIVLAEWNCNKPISVKAVQVDGVTMKEDTFYELKDGVFIEVYKDED